MQIDAAQWRNTCAFVLAGNRAKMSGVASFTPQLILKRNEIMDNQKQNNGNTGNLGREGAGASMGKDLNKDANNIGDKARDMGKDLSNQAANAGASISNAAGNALDKAKDMAKDASNTVQASASDMHNKIDKAADAAQPIVDRLASSAHAGVDKLSGALAGATQGMDERTRQLTDAARNFADTGRSYVRSSPATSVLVALGAGYLLSKILGGRR
jgi:ElaB/YqjD/DUF883 family membrane-anchored ribosome-binding protein